MCLTENIWTTDVFQVMIGLFPVSWDTVVNGKVILGDKDISVTRDIDPPLCLITAEDCAEK